MVLPIVKLGSLLVRTVSKPVASRIKQAAAHHSRFRQVIIDLAQGYHRVTTMMQRVVIGRSTTIEIRPLNEQKAIEAATDLLGELFVFTVAGIAIVYEVQRSARAEAKKEEKRKQELEAVKKDNEALSAELILLKQKLAEVEQLAKQRNLLSFWNWGAYQTSNMEKTN